MAEGTTKGVFGNGRSSLFKYSEEKLKGELLEHPLRAIFADLQDQKGFLYRKSIFFSIF